MNQDQALQILINAVGQANLKGAFTLTDSKVIAEAVEVFTKPPVEAKKVEEKKK